MRAGTGSSDTTVAVAIPFQSGTASVNGISQNLTGLTLRVSVNFTLLPARSNARQQELRLAFTSANEDPNHASQAGLVTVLGLDLPPGSTLDLTTQSKLSIALTHLLCRHASTLDFLFASLNLVPAGAASWLAPVNTAFSYWETAHLDPTTHQNVPEGHLVILATTSNRDVSQLSRTPDDSLVTGGGEVAYGISEMLFATQVLRPVLPAAFGHGLSADQFQWHGGSLEADVNYNLPNVTSGAVRYTPHVTHHAISVTGGSVQTVTNGDADLGAGYVLNFTLTSTQPFVWNAANQTYSFARDPRPHCTQTNNAHDNLGDNLRTVQPIVDDSTHRIKQHVGRDWNEEEGDGGGGLLGSLTGGGGGGGAFHATFDAL